MNPSPEIVALWRAFRASKDTWYAATGPERDSTRQVFEEAKAMLVYALDAELAIDEACGMLTSTEAPLALKAAA